MSTEKPKIRQERIGQCDPHDVLSHPAFGAVTLTRPQGRSTLFGSSVQHAGCMRISVHQAELHRNRGHDMHMPGKELMCFEMSYSQFAQFITGVGQGNGTPCTLRYYSEARAQVAPNIAEIETKHETFTKEIKAMARDTVRRISEHVKEIEEMAATGRVSQKRLKEVLHSLRCTVDNTPSNMAFVVDQAQEALEHEVTSAKIEVEAFIDGRVRSLGLESLDQIARLEHKSS